jgi:hypothetical protein
MKKSIIIIMLFHYSCANLQDKFNTLDETFIALIYDCNNFFIYEICEDDMNLKDSDLFKKLQKNKATVIYRLTEEQYKKIYKEGTEFSQYLEYGGEGYYVYFYVAFAKVKLKRIEDGNGDFKIHTLPDLNTDCFNFEIKYVDANLMFEKIEILKEKKIISNCSN